MREAPIQTDSEIVGVKAFAAGRPVFVALTEDELPHQRWRTYLSCPIYFEGAEGDHLPVGSIVLASRYSHEESSLSPESDKAAIIRIIELMKAYGAILALPNSNAWNELLEENDFSDLSE
ncbi:hypothetical protein [Rathayibacter rathayi]|uniref:hypothetical protein n=1 Tax=Rathayibacter rathayi TaxID=33887 RepID=UPI0011B0EB32|nr:hypothetical protein [Rathayibacter rathayi]